MEEEKPRVQKVLECLYETDGSVKPKEIGEKIGESAMNIGKDLYDLSAKRGLAEKLDDGSWQITNDGRDYVESGGQPKAEPKPKPTEPTEVSETVPSQADLFKGIGERLGVGARKGDVKLEAIMYYVQRTADLDNLLMVWNALTEMGVANDVKKRWIKLYAQTIPGKEIPEELKERIETGLEGEKVKVEAGEVSPKPKRFSIVNGQLIGDPEGDYNFKEALQLIATQKGASPGEAETFAVQMAKLGPDMMSTMMGAITPLIPKEGAKPDNTMMQVLEQRIEKLADEKHKAELDSLRAEMKSGQRSPETDQQIQNLSTQIETLREELHKQELARIQERNQALINELSGKINQLTQQIADIAQGKSVDSKFSLMSEGLKGILEEVRGARGDAMKLAPGFIGRAEKPELSAGEKTAFGEGLDKAIERQKEARSLEDDLFFGTAG